MNAQTSPEDTSEAAQLLPPFGFVPHESALDMTWPIAGWVHPLLTCVSGQPETGKTTLVHSWCASLLRGDERWGDGDVTFPPDASIMFGCEDRAGVARLRDLFPADYRAGRLLPFVVTPYSGERIAGGFREARVGLLVIDSMFKWASNTNDQARSGEVIAALGSCDVPVVVIHHSARTRNSAGQQTPGPGGAQAYRAAYRHTVHVAKSAGPEMTLKLRAWGNDVGKDTDRTVTLSRDTLEVIPHAVVPRKRELKRPRSAGGDREAQSDTRTVGQRLQAIYDIAASVGLNRADVANNSEIARALRASVERDPRVGLELARLLQATAPPSEQRIRRGIGTMRKEICGSTQWPSTAA